MNLLKQSTAATIKLGPFIDDGDGKSAETGLTISQADIRLSKNGGDFAQTHNSAGATADELGYYDVPLDTTDTNTLGRLLVAVHESGALPVWQDFLVVTANVYDTLCSTDNLDVNVATIATDAITAAALKADAVTEIQSGLALEATLTAIKGAGWTDETLLAIYSELANGFGGASVEDAVETAIYPLYNHIIGIKGVGWTDETMVSLMTAIEAISAGSGATPQQIWEYATRTLTAGTNIDLSALATATNLAAVKSDTAAILADTGTDGVIIGATQGAITWGQQKIVANVAGEGALDIENINIDGAGQHNKGGSTSVGLLNEGIVGTVNDGASIGLVNSGSKAVVGYDPALALEATLTDIKGTGWTNQTLVKIVTDIAAISAGSGATPQQIWEYATRTLTAGTNIDLSALATAAKLDIVNENLVNVDGKADTAATLLGLIKAKTDNLPADPADDSDIDTAIAAVKSVVDDILVDTGTTLDTLVKDIPTNAELATALGTADDAVLAAVAAAKVVIDDIHDTDLPAVKAETALIVEDTGTTIPALLETIDNFLDTEVAAILEDTGTTLPATLATLAGYTDGIAGDVWSYAKRTLTHPSVSAEEPEDSNTLILYRDADIAIELTDLTIPAGAKKYIFTIKDNLDSGDDQAVLQASYAIDGSEVETNTLVYINSAAAPVLTNPVTFTLTDTNITIDLTAEAAALLPRYERGYLNWDLKLVTDASVTIVLQGLAQIIGTSTRAIE